MLWKETSFSKWKPWIKKTKMKKKKKTKREKSNYKNNLVLFLFLFLVILHKLEEQYNASRDSLCQQAWSTSFVFSHYTLLYNHHYVFIGHKLAFKLRPKTTKHEPVVLLSKLHLRGTEGDVGKILLNNLNNLFASLWNTLKYLGVCWAWNYNPKEKEIIVAQWWLLLLTFELTSFAIHRPHHLSYDGQP